MPANLAAMPRSMLKAKQTASSMELRLLREVARTLPTMDGASNAARMKPNRIRSDDPRAKATERSVHVFRVEEIGTTIDVLNEKVLEQLSQTLIKQGATHDRSRAVALA